MDSIKKISFNALLIVLSLACTLIAVEMLLRGTSYSKLLPYSGIPPYYYAADSATGYDISSNFGTSTHRFAGGTYDIWSNNLGCFDMPYEDEQPYVYVGGDSFAWGFTPFADKWGTQLQTWLGTRVVKCGVPGYGTKQELHKAQKTLGGLATPSLILISYFANDPGDDAAFPNSLIYKGQLIKNLSNDPTLTYDQLVERLPQYAQWAQEYCMWNMPVHPTLQRVKCYLRNHSILYLLAQSAIKPLIGMSFLRHVGVVNEEPPLPPVDDTAAASHEAAILGFKTLARTVGAPLIFVFVPASADVYSTSTTTAYATEKQLMNKNAIPYFDPLPEFQKAAAATSTPLYWSQDPHLNAEGNHLLGLLVAQYLLEKKHDAASLQTVKTALQKEFGI